MDKVKIVFYENYGNKKIKTVHNVIPTSISTRYRMGCCGKKEIYLNYDIMDEISHHGCFALNEGIVYSIFPENNTQKENQKKVIHELSKKVIEQLKKRENLNAYIYVHFEKCSISCILFDTDTSITEIEKKYEKWLSSVEEA